MKLSDYIRPMAEPARSAFARECGTTFLHLRNVAFSGKACGVHLAVAVEAKSDGAVRRWELRSHDWHLIWPELIGTEGAPPIPEEVRDAA